MNSRYLAALAATASLLLVVVSLEGNLVFSGERLSRLRVASNGDRSAATLETAKPKIAPAGRNVSSASNVSLQFRGSSVHAQVAGHAPIIISNGGDQPIALGAWVPNPRKTLHSLHVWDWSKSSKSRVLPDVDLGRSDRIVVSPDGTKLLWSNGNILDLRTGQRTFIDLGGEVTKIGSHIYTRIAGMQFSPDGGLLALLVRDMDDEQPGLIKREVVQIIEFASGKRLCEFPSYGSRRLRIGFSRNGRQIVSGTGLKQVFLRDAATGKVLQRFVPALDTRNMDVAISPDGSQVAAVGDVNTSDDSDTTGGIFLWNAVSGQLVHRLPASRFKNFGFLLPSAGFLLPSAGLRYSPDGKHLAVIFPFRVVVIDVATGEIAASLRSSGGTASVQWSTNGDRITAVSVVSLGTGPGGVEFDVYPSVKEWGWRSGELVRTMTSPAP